MLKTQDLLVYFMHFYDTGRYLSKRRSMQGINARKVSLPYADPGIFVGEEGSRPACLKTALAIFLVLNLNILQL